VTSVGRRLLGYRFRRGRGAKERATGRFEATCTATRADSCAASSRSSSSSAGECVQLPDYFTEYLGEGHIASAATLLHVQNLPLSFFDREAHLRSPATRRCCAGAVIGVAASVIRNVL
jgi:hypothetical protein